MTFEDLPDGECYVSEIGHWKGIIMRKYEGIAHPAQRGTSVICFDKQKYVLVHPKLTVTPVAVSSFQ